jgi:hypothetical protein
VPQFYSFRCIPAKGNGSKFTVLSVATQRSWKNADGPADDAIRQLPDNYKPKHYGKEAARERAQ